MHFSAFSLSLNGIERYPSFFEHNISLSIILAEFTQ